MVKGKVTRLHKFTVFKRSCCSLRRRETNSRLFLVLQQRDPKLIILLFLLICEEVALFESILDFGLVFYGNLLRLTLFEAVVGHRLVYGFLSGVD